MTRTMPPPTSHASPSSLSLSSLGRARLRLSDDLVTAAAHHLTDRDRSICALVAEHRVLTTDQIATVAFDSPISARHRLAMLYRLRVLDRFRPFRRVGTAPNHWVLDAIGAMVVAARGRPAADLRVWWPERRCRATWGEVVRPDGYGVWQDAGAELAFFLEYDRGTETHARLVAKLEGYATLAAAARDPFWVLFWFTGPEREAAARKALAGAPVPVATACEGAPPSDAVWLPAGTSSGRRRLAELGASPMPRGADR